MTTPIAAPLEPTYDLLTVGTAAPLALTVEQVEAIDSPELRQTFAGRLAVTAADLNDPDTPTDADEVFVAFLVPEGIATDDGRYMAPGSISPRMDRLPLMASDRNLPAHLQAEFIGNLIDFARTTATAEEGGVGEWVTAAVDFDTDPSGLEWQRMVTEDRIRGVSVDLAVLAGRIRTTDEDGNPVYLDADTHAPLEDQEQADWPGEDIWLVVDEGLILGATMVPMPAFRNARIEPATPTEAIAAAMAARMPQDWLQAPVEATRAFRSHVDPNGRLRGHGAAWGTCLVGRPGCTTPPNSATGYTLARRVPAEPGALLVPIYWQDAGDLYSHAPLHLPWWEAITWYEQHCDLAGVCMVGEDTFGIWTSGYALDYINGRHLSGDWRPHGDAYELIGWSIVDRPGFPVPEAIAAAKRNHWAIVGAATPCDHDPAEDPTNETHHGDPRPDLALEALAEVTFTEDTDSDGKPWIDSEVAELVDAVRALTVKLGQALDVAELEYNRHLALRQSADLRSTI